MFADFCIIFMDSLQLSAVNLRCVRLGSASFGRRPLQFVHGYLTKFINDINIDYWKNKWKSVRSDQNFTILMLWKLILPTQQVPNWNANIKSFGKNYFWYYCQHCQWRTKVWHQRTSSAQNPSPFIGKFAQNSSFGNRYLV